MQDEEARRLERAAREDERNADAWLAWGRALAATGDVRGEAILTLAHRALRLRSAAMRSKRLGISVRDAVSMAMPAGPGWSRKATALSHKAQVLAMVRTASIARAFAGAKRLGVVPRWPFTTGRQDLVDAMTGVLNIVKDRDKARSEARIEVELDSISAAGPTGPASRCAYPTKRARCPMQAIKAMVFRSPAGELMAVPTCEKHGEILESNLSSLRIKPAERPVRAVSPDAVARAVNFVLGAKAKYGDSG